MATLKEQAITVLGYLNKVTGRNYRPVPATLKPIIARIKEGFTLGDCMDVIDVKAKVWLKDDKMNQYLRPMTLFAGTNFANYSGEIPSKEGK